MKLSDDVRSICWAFGRGDSRWDAVIKLADKIAELETRLAAREATCCARPIAHAGHCEPGRLSAGTEPARGEGK